MQALEGLHIAIVGLPGTAKTAAAWTFYSLGCDFGPLTALHQASLEHPDANRMMKRICMTMEEPVARVEERIPYNAAYTSYDGVLHTRALHANDPDQVPTRQQGRHHTLPEMVKVPYPAALPVLADMYDIRFVLLCLTSSSRWEQQIKSTDFFYQRTADPKPDLARLWEQHIAWVQMTCWKHAIPMGLFTTEDVMAMSFTDFDQKARDVLGFDEHVAQQRFDALQAETGGRLGMQGVGAPLRPDSNWPTVR